MKKIKICIYYLIIHALLLQQIDILCAIEYSECSLYYSTLDARECEEMMDIYYNYSFYDSELKEIASLRVAEIKENLYTDEERVALVLKNIENPDAYSDLPDGIKDSIGVYSKSFRRLAQDVKEELIVYAINGYNKENLSNTSLNYLDNKPSFLLE
ncbi:hypothetical protein GUI12_04385 [Anaplasmataceae bacterium AB001_6]|nr:hypothetical protein GUI12_04385 [Anaplasmataceae bacterium AB001_6]